MSKRGPKPKTPRNKAQAIARAIPLNAIEPTSDLDVDALKHFYRLLADLDRMGILERVDITLATEAARTKELLDKAYQLHSNTINPNVITAVTQLTSRYQGLVRMLGLSVQPSRSVVKTVAKDSKQADPIAAKIKLHA